MRTVRSLAVLIALALALGPVAAAPQPTLLIGCVVSLTGALSNEGRLTKEGYDFWARYVNARGGLRVGKQRYAVEIRYADDESSPPNTARLIEKLLDGEHVQFLLGPYGAAATFAAATVAERRGVPLVDSSGAAERIFNQGYRYTF